jgi:transcriptional regulator with XRE-family HTH domain
MLEDVIALNPSHAPTHTHTLVEVEEAPALPVTEPSLSQLTDQAGFLRTTVRALQEDTDDLHRRIRSLLTRRTEHVKETSVELLERLSELGFAWRQIAKMIGVSVPAVQKWRRGERMTAENFERLAMLLSVCDLLPEFHIADPASWFEVRILPDVPIRPMDLFAAGHDEQLLDWASGHIQEPERILDMAQPDWRDRYATEFEVFKADDGELALRLKNR